MDGDRKNPIDEAHTAPSVRRSITYLAMQREAASALADLLYNEGDFEGADIAQGIAIDSAWRIMGTPSSNLADVQAKLLTVCETMEVAIGEDVDFTPFRVGLNELSSLLESPAVTIEAAQAM